MSTRLGSYLSQLLSITRNLVPSQQELFDGVARFVAILLIYTITISTSVSLGAMPLGAERSVGESARFDRSVASIAGDPVAKTRSTQSLSSGAEKQHGVIAPESGQMISSAAVPTKAQSARPMTQVVTPAAACLYALDPSAQDAFSITGSTSVSFSCSAVVESTATQSFYMGGTETLNLQNNAQVGVVGGYLLSGQTSIVNTTTGQKVTPVTIASPGDPFPFLPAPTQGTIVGKSHTSYDMNNKPANNTLVPGIYCGGLTIGNTNGATFTMSPGTYIMAGGGFTINSLGIVSGSGVTVYNTSSTGWGCSASSSYTPITISGQANLTLTAPSSGALAGVIFFGDRTGCSTLGSCQNQINSGSITKLNGAMYFKSDTLVFSGTASNTGCMTVAADKININGNSPFAITGCTSTVGGVTVSVSPAVASLYAGQTQQYSATVMNASNTAVTWSVAGAGTISSSGLYTAPASVASQQTVTITATSQAEPSVSASANLTLLPPISVSVAPMNATLYGGQTQQFSSSVSNTSNSAVNWSISPAGTGAISASGLYTAPASIATQQTVTITATSQADSSKSATATVTLMPAVVVSISPTSSNLYAGQTQQFSASVANTSNPAVNWSINPVATGSVSASGLYTAPTSVTKQQTVTVTATSQADSTKSASANVTVNVPVPVITSITPSTAAPSSQITLVGQNFMASPGTVMLNGISLPTSSWSNTSISLAVPTNNCTGPVVVTTQYGTSNSVTLTISGTELGCMNPLPVANAGPAQTVSIGATVQLDGTGSTDQMGNPLTYSWTFVSMPSGSAANLSTPSVPKPSFVADVYGNYTLQLVVNDGYRSSAPSQVVISTKDSAPVANAGQNQTVPTHTQVRLDGNSSTDVDGIPLTYSWSFVSLPPNSTAVLANPTSVNPTFATDKKGSYVVQLVVNDGQLNSAPSTVTISDVNTPPVANAGANQTVQIGSTVQLNGSGSTDVDGDSLTYRWAILSAPAGSTATLSSTTIVNPTFVADVPGNFVAQLIVNDGTVDSTPVTVTIGNQDIAPVANAGVGQTVAVGALVSLDGTGSTDSDSRSLTYLWSILSAPNGSLAALTSATAPNPAFTADKYGNYVVQLIVNDGYLNSNPATVTISTIYTSPVANPGPTQRVTTGATVALTGAASTSNDGYSLTYRWSLTSKPTGSAATLANASSVTPSFVANVAGAYVVQLIVNDTVSDSSPQTVMITAVDPNQPPVVNAGPDQTAYLPNAVTLTGTATDDGLPVGSVLTVQWSMLSGPGKTKFSNPNSAAATVTFDQPGTYVLQLSANDTQYTTTSTCTVTYLTASKKAPVVSAGTNQTVPIPNNLPLQGSVTSADIPPGTPSAQWSVLSTTPAGLVATFANATSPKTTVSLPQAGTYVLQLTGTEAGLSANSTVTITGQTGSQPPTVNAGPNQSIELPANSVTLSGAATDPAGGTLSYLWSQASGPSTVSLQNANALKSNAVFTTAGTYIFRLAATSSASGLSTSATTQVIVYGQNQPPVVNAGPNQTIVLPTNTAQLSGTATDDGLPLGSTLSVHWSEVSGPAQVSFANANAISTTVAFPQMGTYVLRLTASDTQLQSSSNVTVVVNPAGFGETLTLTPSTAGPDVVSTPQALSAILRDSFGIAIASSLVQFTVTGANSQTGSATTDSDGNATFTYIGANKGTDTVQAVVGSATSNTATVNWILPIQNISTSPVTGAFFASDESGVFDTPPTATPVFTQSFPTINFNPPTGIISETMQVTVDGRSVPWRVNGSINSAYYLGGLETGLDPASIAVSPGQTVNLNYVSGLWSQSNPIGTQYGMYGNNWGAWDANGNPGTPWGTPLANSASLIGGFADATGQIVGSGPLLIGNSFSAIVPTGATQLLMGLHDGGDWSDNSGALFMNVTISSPSTGIGVNTHPFTDVTTDANGNYTGTIVAQGNGVQAGGIGPLYAFQSVFTGTFAVPSAGDVSLDIFSNAAFILGVGGGAARVSGPSVNGPANGLTAFAGLPVMGAYNAPQEASNTIVMSFPAPGSYPYELDYADSGAGGNPINLALDHLSLTMGLGLNNSVGQTNTKVVPPSTGSLAISPLSPPTLNTGQTQTLSVTALDPAGAPVANLPVALVINGMNQQELLANTNTSGIVLFSYIGSNAGTDTVEAVSNISGQRALSNTVNVPWSSPSGLNPPPQPNLPPVVNAGTDQEITLPTCATLNGTVTDDGLPLGAPLTQWWSQVAGPGVWEYATGKQIVLDHTKVPSNDQQDFPVLISGTYSFLANEANGGNVQNAHGWDIIFTSDVAGQNKLDHEIDSYDPTTGTAAFWVRIPTLSHTTDTTIYMWYGNSAIVASQENKKGVWKNGYVEVWHFNDLGGSLGTRGSGNGTPLPTVASGFLGNNGLLLTAANSNSVTMHSPVNAGSTMTVETWLKPANLSNYRYILSNLTNSTNPGYALRFDNAPSDQRLVAFEGSSFGESWQITGPTVSSGAWTHVVHTSNGSENTTYFNAQPVSYAQTSGGGQPVGTSTTNLVVGNIAGYSYYYDGLIDELRVSSVVRSADWVATEYNNQVSPSTFYSIQSIGEGLVFSGNAVTFSNPSAPVTQATFSTPGTYVLQLSASDTQYTSTSQVTVTVYPAQTANQPPVVSAGANQTITLPSQATLAGSVTDDGLPAGSIVTSQWTSLSGPAPVVFGNANQPTTTATFSQAGIYVLQLSASDTQYTSSATVTIAVNSSVTSTNQPPVLGAHPSMPAIVGTPMALNGTATDDGLPNGTLIVQWTRISGPGSASFANPNLASSQVTFGAAGTYVLQLSAGDSQYTRTLTLTIPVAATPTSGGTNQPPTVSAGVSQTITLPTASLTLNGLAKDDGLPDGQLSIAWTELSGSAGVVFSNPYAAATQVTFPTSGVYLLQLSANDGQYTATSTVTVVVNPVPSGGGTGGTTTPAQPPTLSISAPGTVILPNSATFVGRGASASGALTYQWSQVSGPAGAVISAPTQASTQVTFAQVGNYSFQLAASDGQLSTTGTLSVTVESQPGALPSVQISQPVDGTDVKSATAIVGSVSGGNWKLGYAPITAAGTGTYQIFAAGTGASSGTLGTLDPSILLNGSYSILLSTVDQWGQTATANTSVSVDGNLKLGAFSIAFQDLSVPLPGLPITITRTYDSRDRSQGDFGDGWRLSIANVRVQKNGGPLGQTWDEEMSWSGYSDSYCLGMAKNHTVTATFPDGRVFKFAPSTSKTCQSYGTLTETNLTFTQVSTGSSTAGATLSVLDGGDVIVSGSIPGPVDLTDYNGNYYDSTQFKLTTADGYVYYLDLTLGVTKLVDPNGNTLTINASGVVSSSGPSVAFSRDGQGRISSIADPTGALVSYEYSSSGDLNSVTDRAQNRTTFEYDNSHYLKTIKDPRRVSAVRNTYDDSGRLVSTMDANGNTIKYTPNMAANQEQIADQLGNITLYTYDNDGNITQKTDPLGNVTSYTYDGNDNQLSQTVYLGSRALTTSYTYDGVGNKLTDTDPLGNTTNYTYNSRKQVLSVSDALKRLTSNVYDDSGNLTSTTDPNGKETKYFYNGNGTIASVTDPLSNTTNFGYDGQGNLTSQLDALGNSSSYTYDANNNKLSQTVTRTLANGALQKLTTSYEYDGNNRITKTHLPDGTYTEVHYNSIGKQDQTWDAKRNQTSYTYDDTGRLTQTAYPDGTTDSTVYDADGHRTSYSDRGGHTTSYSYDAAGRMTTTTYPDGSISKTNYDSANRVYSTVDRNNNTTSYAYDDAGRRTEVTDALNNITRFVYDIAGQQISVTDARNNIVQYTYDADGRQTRTTYPDQSFSETGYDALGRMTSKTDQAGVITGYGYDNLGRLTSVRQDVGGLNLVTSYGYDELGNRIAQTDAAKRTTKYAYDQLGRRSQRTLPLGQSESYGYEANGNLSSKTDFNSHTTTYAYDATNRLLSKTPDASFQSAPVTFTYTATGKRQTMTDPSGVTTYTYDPVTDRLMSKQTPFGTISYTYDAAGDVTEISSSNAYGAAMAYQYDKLNRLATVTVPGQSPTLYSYDDVGNLAGYTYPNGVSTTLQYDPLNRLTSLASQGAQGAVASYQYTLGAAGNRTGVTELSGRTVAYGYDNLYRLTSETIANDLAGMNGATGYVYDTVGNRQQMTSTLPAIAPGRWNYDANDRLTSDQNDADGNITSRAGVANAYDFENHLVQHGFMTFVYDGDGNRVAKTIGGVTTTYLVDTLNPTGYAQVLDELQSNTVMRSYTWGLQLVSESQLTAATPPTNPWVTSWYGLDGHGSVRYLTNSAGAVTDSYDYDAFGNLISSTGSTANNYLFAGEQFDPDLGLYYNRARYLDVQLGRFWGMDTHRVLPRDPATIHRFLYTRGNPVNRVDRTGREDLAELGITEDIGETLDSMALPQRGAQLSTEIGEELSATTDIAADVGEDVDVLAEEVEGVEAQEGEWVEETISNPRAANYQAKITGRPGEAFKVNGVKFDGGGNAGELLEAKGPGYAKLLQQKFGNSVLDKLVAQAERQVAAAGGRQIVWHFAEQEAADAFIEAISKTAINVIKVVVTAP